MAGMFKNAEEGRGFLEGRHLKVTGAGWVIFDGNGYWDRESTCLHMELTDVDGGLTEPVDQYWSVGKPDEFIPQNKGKSIKRKNDKNMSKLSNCYRLFVSMVNAGVPEDIVDTLEDDATQIIGMELRMGKTMRSKKDTKGLDTVDEVFVMPGENDPEGIAKQIIDQILANNGDAVDLKSLPKKVGEALDGYEEDFAKAVRKVAINQKFLKENYTVEGNTVAA